MRKDPTPQEFKLWQRLRASQLAGFKFRQQAQIDPFIVDFLCPAVGLIVELDGDTHVADRDRDRDIALGKDGYTVLRFSNADIGANIEGVLEAILLKARDLPVRTWQRSVTHPPAPSLGREGEL